MSYLNFRGPEFHTKTTLTQDLKQRLMIPKTKHSSKPLNPKPPILSVSLMQKPRNRLQIDRQGGARPLKLTSRLLQKDAPPSMANCQGGEGKKTQSPYQTPPHRKKKTQPEETLFILSSSFKGGLESPTPEGHLCMHCKTI